MNFANSKKGQIKGTLVAVIFIFTFGFLSIFGMTLYSAMRDAWIDAGQYTGVVQETGDKIFEAYKMYDWIIVLILAVMIIAIGLANFRLRTNPAFFIITFIQGIFAGFVSYFFNYVFIQIVSDSVFSATLAFFPRTLLICTNLHWVALILLVVSSITLFGKRKSEQPSEVIRQ